MDEIISEEEANRIYRMIKEDAYPPTNPVVLSKAQLHFALKGQPKKAACIAQWVVDTQGGHIDYDTWKKLCETE